MNCRRVRVTSVVKSTRRDAGPSDPGRTPSGRECGRPFFCTSVTVPARRRPLVDCPRTTRPTAVEDASAPRPHSEICVRVYNLCRSVVCICRLGVGRSGWRPWRLTNNSTGGLKSRNTRRRHEVIWRLLMEFADQRQPRLTRSEPRKGNRAIAAVDGKHEVLLGKPPRQHAQQFSHEVERLLGALSPALVLLGRTVQRKQHRQGPRADHSGQWGREDQHQPFVPERLHVIPHAARNEAELKCWKLWVMSVASGSRCQLGI